MKCSFIFVFLAVFVNASAQSYTLQGSVFDIEKNPIEAVTCILLSDADSTYQKAVISDQDGMYLIENIPEGKYKLLFQHLAFDRSEILLLIEKNTVLEPVILSANSLHLTEVEIRGERPLVKAEEGKLIYDAQQLIKGKVTTNALEALQQVPNVIGNGDELQLAGAPAFNVLINGQPTGMSLAQVIRMLKAMPSSKVKSVEIMYSTPPQYNVRGSSINIVLDGLKVDVPEWQGEINMNYSQKHNAAYGTRANIMYTKPTLSADLTVDGTTSKAWGYNAKDDYHILDGTVYNIKQENHFLSKNKSLSMRAALNLDFINKDKLQVVYTLNYDHSNSTPLAKAKYYANQNHLKTIDSRNNSKGSEWLHNLKLDYISHFKLKVGVDYTSYKDPETILFHDYNKSVLISLYKTSIGQHIDKLMAYANHSSEIINGWKMTYGGSFSLSKNNNDYDYFKNTESIAADSTSITRQKEYNASFFASINKSFGQKISGQLSVSGNYFRATIDNSIEGRKTLWNEFKPFLNGSLTFTPSVDNLLQLSFSTDITYPQYWALSPNERSLNAYSVVVGNPELKFSTAYNTHVLYMFKRKYTLVAFYKYQPDFVIQLPYQSDKELKTIFKMVNLDYRKTAGLSLNIPFKINRIFDSRVNLIYMYTKDKDGDFFNEAYTKDKNSFIINFNNTVNISSKPDLKLDLSAFYISGAVQGIYDIHHMSRVNAGLKWIFMNNNAELMARVEDIFKGNGAVTSINYNNQRSRMEIDANAPAFTLSFVYRFGNFKQKKVDKVDTSRFGRRG